MLNLTQYQIRATAEQSLPSEIFQAIPGMLGTLLWNYDKGPAENFLHLVDLGAMIIPTGISQIIILLANVLGLNFAALGRYIDKTMGWAKLEDLTSAKLEDVVQKLTGFDRTEQSKILRSFQNSPMSAFNKAERDAYDGFVSEARGNVRRSPAHRSHSKKPNESRKRTPEEQSEYEFKKKRHTKVLEKKFKDDVPFLENFNNIVINGGGLFAMLSKITNVKLTPGVVIIAITGLIKWVMSMAWGLAKTMFAHKKVGAALLAGGVAASAYAYYKWFAGDDASEEDINKGVESGANIFGEKVRNGLDSLAPEKRDFRGTLEYLIDGAMIK